MDNKILITLIVLALLFLGVGSFGLEVLAVEEADNFIEEKADVLLERYKEVFNAQDMDLMKGIGMYDFYAKTMDFFHYDSDIDEIEIDSFRLKDYKIIAEDQVELDLEYQGVLKLSGSHRNIKGNFSLNVEQIADFYIAIDTDLYQKLEMNWERELTYIICDVPIISGYRGTKESPFLIHSIEGLKFVGDEERGYPLDAYYKLANDSIWGDNNTVLNIWGHESSVIAEKDLNEELESLLEWYREVLNEKDFAKLNDKGLYYFYNKTKDFLALDSKELEVLDLRLKDYEKLKNNKLEAVINYQGILERDSLKIDIEGDFALTLMGISGYNFAADTDFYELLAEKYICNENDEEMINARLDIFAEGIEESNSEKIASSLIREITINDEIIIREEAAEELSTINAHFAAFTEDIFEIVFDIRNRNFEEIVEDKSMIEAKLFIGLAMPDRDAIVKALEREIKFGFYFEPEKLKQAIEAIRAEDDAEAKEYLLAAGMNEDEAESYINGELKLEKAPMEVGLVKEDTDWFISIINW